MAVIELLSGAFLVAQFAYHRWKENKERETKSRHNRIPYSEDGVGVPLLFGTCRTEPYIAWTYVDSIDADDNVLLKIHLVIGIAMNDGKSTTAIKRMWAGDTLIYGPGLSYFTGSYASPLGIPADLGQGTGHVELLSGSDTQVVVANGENSGNASTYLGRAMLAVASEDEIPSYRGYASAFLFSTGNPQSCWVVPGPMEVPAYSFEVTTYEDAHSYPATGIAGRIGEDSNPANVIYDIITAKRGKLGHSTDVIDHDTFSAAAAKLAQESHGFSCAFDASETAESMIEEVLRQIDGVMDEDPATGKVILKLIRNDYDPNDSTSVRVINRSNARIDNLVVGGWADLPNKIRVNFSDRERNYQEGSAFAANLANAVGQDGLVREQVVRYRGVSHQALADALAGRELMARCRPLIRVRAYVDRSFLSTTRGDVVKLVWTDPDINGLIFRVADVDRGPLDSNEIALDLVQDYFYVWRNQIPQPAGLGDYGPGDGVVIDFNW